MTIVKLPAMEKAEIERFVKEQMVLWISFKGVE